MKWIVFACLLWCKSIYSAASQLEAAIEPPLVYNSYQMSQDLGTFTCVTRNSQFIRWIVNGVTHIRDFVRFTREIDVFTWSDESDPKVRYSMIMIPAISVNKNIMDIKCIAYTINPEETTESHETAQFNIQGLLDMSPIITYSSYNTSHIAIEWQEPLTLDITDVEPDIENYTVCTNVSSSDCVNTTAPNFTIPKFHMPISVSVTAWNIVGESNSSANLEIDGCFTEMYPLEEDKTFVAQVAFEADNITTVYINFPENQTESDEVCLYLYEVSIHSRGSMAWSTTTQLYGDKVSIALRLHDLQKNHPFTININRTTYSSALILRPVDFSTHNLQNVDIDNEGNEILWITCDFALGATSEGLTIEVVNEIGVVLQKSFNLSAECPFFRHIRPCSVRTSFDLSPLLEMSSVGNILISVSDWEESGVVNNVLFKQLILPSTNFSVPPTTEQYTTHQKTDYSIPISVILSASIGGGAIGTVVLFSLALIVLGIFCKKCIRKQDHRPEQGAAQDDHAQAVPNEAYALVLQMKENDAYEATSRNQAIPTTNNEVHLYDEIELPPTDPRSEPVYAEVTH